ncbi:MAG: tetratricopeptide repeat protein [Deltaproteobacteria bacterium]|nr:tetratricopeptide repeat protein [Deltaproteobacteria bacterium]
MKSNNNYSKTRRLDHLTKFAHSRFLILFALTAVFIFLPVLVSESASSEAKNEYHDFYVVSSYENFGDAETLVDRLKAQGYDPFCKTVNLPKKGKRRRVFIKQYGDREEALLAGKGLRERGVIKSFFLLLKAGPKDKRIALRGNADKEDNKSTPPPSTLTKIKIFAAPPVPDSTKEKTDPPKTEEVVALSHKTDKGKFYKITYDTDIEAAPPHKTADIDLKMDDNPYDSAMSDFASGKYEDALSKFKEIPESGKNETALRRMADCYWFLGEEKGDKRYFLEAVDRYRNIIRNYPDSGEENGPAVYRLAESYSRLNLHYEALMEFKNVCSKYPESDYAPKALYMMGKIYYKTKKFDEAIGKFKEYIERFPDGKHVRTAYFSVGDCYSRMRRFNDADVWYDDALEKWPALEDIPEFVSRRQPFQDRSLYNRSHL